MSFQRYQLCYPDEAPAKHYSFELDKENHRFRTVGAPDSDDEHTEYSDYDEPSVTVEERDGREDLEEVEEQDGMEKLDQDLANLKVSQEDLSQQPQPSHDEILKELHKDPSWRLSLFFSYCIENDVGGVKELLSTYEDPFLQSKDKQGDNCISLASIEGHLEMVRLLHRRGGSIHNTNNRGRTPLMEAALWGRPRVVEFLLKQGVDPQIEDRKGRKALYYALPSPKTTSMRAECDHYIEAPTAESDRRIIAMMLRAREPMAPEPETNDKDSGSGHFLLSDTQSEITFFERSTSYAISDKHKTIARLDRGKLFPIVSSASGWRSDFAVGHIVDNIFWTQKVRGLCHVLGYELKANEKDRSEPAGTYFASHAEKKLIAYYIDKHMVIPLEALENRASQDGREWVEESKEYQDLVEVQPSPHGVKATILVSRPTCLDCMGFQMHIEKVLGIKFEVRLANIVH